MMTKQLVCDVETTGLTPGQHQILQIGLAVYENDTLVDTRSIEVDMHEWSDISAEALESNEVALGDRDETYPYVEAPHQVAEFVNSHFPNSEPKVLGHNFSFDLGFLEDMFDRVGMDVPFHYHYKDSMILALAVRDAELRDLWSVSLDTVSKYFGVDEDITFHSAVDDCKATFRVYQQLLEVIQ